MKDLTPRSSQEVGAPRPLETQLNAKINPAVRFSVSRFVLAIGFFLAVMVFGLFSTSKLGVDLLPSITVPVVFVSTTYSGATAEVMDEQVTKVIESAVSTMSGVSEIESSSSAGSSRVILNFETGSNATEKMNQVSALVSAASLPDNAAKPSVRTFDPNSAAILQFGVEATNGANLTEVGKYVDNTLVPQLQLVAGVADVSSTGVPARKFQVYLNSEKLQSFGINPQTVTTAIANANLNQPIGSVTTNSNTVTFTTKVNLTNATDIAAIVVDPATGVTVGDLAVVRDVSVTESIARVNGKPVVLISVKKTTDANSVQVVKDVRKVLATTALPTGYQVDISNDTTGPISASIESTYHELFMTALVVALICLLFLGKLNTAISVIVAIPIALSAAPILYYLAGFSFNTVSLLALITAIGIVVDDSIVVAENVERFRAMGYSLKESVLMGATEVFSAVVAASLSILSVLLPVSFIGGFIGGYIQQFAWGLSAAVLFSLIEAILFLTVRMAYTPDAKTATWPDFFRSFGQVGASWKWALKAWRSPFGLVVLVLGAGALVWFKLWWELPLVVLWPLALAVIHYLGRLVLTLLQALTTTCHGATETVLEWIRDRYVGGLGFVVDHGKWVLVGAAAFFVATLVVIGPQIPFNFVPDADGGSVSLNLDMPAGTSADETNAGAARVENYLMKQKEVSAVQMSISGSGSGAGFGATSASFTVQLIDVTKRAPVNSLTAKWRKAIGALFPDYPSARIFMRGGGGFQGNGNSLTFNVLSADFDVLKERNAALVNAVQSMPGVADVTSSLSTTTIQNNYVPDNDKLKGTGIAASTIATALQYYTTGKEATDTVIGGISYPIQVQVDPNQITGTQSILSLPIYAPTLGTTLQAGQLGSFVLSDSPTSIPRYNRLYEAEISISTTPDAPGALAFQTQLTKLLKDKGILDNGVSLVAGSSHGPAALAGQLTTTGPLAFLLALFLAYLVMGAQFNSWRYPVYLLLPVPLAIAGALWFVFFLHSGLDIFGILGMLLLIGLSAKNAILYLDFVVMRIDKMPLRMALIEAAHLRFRPIVMTTLTVLVISFPLMFATGQGSEYGQKLGIVIAGGILSSAILTFFVVPAAFYLFEKKRTAAPTSTPALGQGQALDVAAGRTM
jgi:HAE1 family hydrophobic/amphiphilic exporter-1